MIAGLSAKLFRPHPAAVGMRQHVASRSNPVMSKQVARLGTLVLAVAFFAVVTVSQLMHWYVSSSVSQLDRLQSIRNNAGSENMGLLAQRARLTSKEYVVENAGSKFKLFLPEKHQIHRL